MYVASRWCRKDDSASIMYHIMRLHYPTFAAFFDNIFLNEHYKKSQKLKTLIEGVGARSDPESPSFFLGIDFGGQILTKYTGFEQKLTNPLNQTMILVSAPFDLCHRGSQGSPLGVLGSSHDSFTYKKPQSMLM